MTLTRITPAPVTGLTGHPNPRPQPYVEQPARRSTRIGYEVLQQLKNGKPRHLAGAHLFSSVIRQVHARHRRRCGAITSAPSATSASVAGSGMVVLT